jgi:uncharacterized protein (DUF362 family)
LGGITVNNPIDRRTFLHRCVSSGTGALIGSLIPHSLLRGHLLSPPETTICAVAGDKIFENTMRAVDAMGGMKKFVKKGASVALLTNSVFDRPGTYVNPDIPLAVVKMCFDAGAKSVITIEDTPGSYWKRSAFSTKLTQEIGMIRRANGKKDVTIGKGKSLKEGSVSADLLSADVFINIPIIKDHQGTRYTGNLKNMMGAFSSSTCRRCHFGDQSIVTQLFQGYYSKMELLSQSIADLNLVRSPDLSVADVTEIISTNGPSGPGRLKTPMEVVAGTNALAVDMYSVRHLGLNPDELLVIKRAQEHALGPQSLNDVRIITK